MRCRPTHLLERPVNGDAFREVAVLIRAEPGDRNEYGEWIPGFLTRQTIDVSTAPATDEDGAIRAVMEGMNDGQGVRLVDARKFWTLDESILPIRTGPDARDADRIEYDGVTYRVVASSRWHAITTAVTVREDPQ